jgi:DNA-binding PadR family transcriptional regulator
MSATRLLVLGIVRGYGRAHGYRVGNDLVSWGADEWANVKWGSIYHALRALTQSGFLLGQNDIPGRTTTSSPSAARASSCACCAMR